MPGLIDQATLDEVWFHYEEHLSGGLLETDDDDAQGPGDVLRGRTLDPHLVVPQLRALLEDRRLVDIAELLLGAEALPFQTIAGHKASQQALHSDSIHMTTYPLGYLVANWIAFEDITADSGPLRFVPGTPGAGDLAHAEHASRTNKEAVSYTHLTLPTKRIV